MPISNPYRRQLLGWKQPFLEAISRGLCVREACRIAGITPGPVYHQRNTDEEFQKEWDRVADLGTELLEQEAQRRAFHGTEKPVFYKGEQCGVIQEYSDTLLMFVLRGRKPEMYRDKDRSGDTNVNVNVSAQANAMAASAIREMIADGTIPRLIEGGGCGEPSPLESSTLDGGGQRREVDTGPTPAAGQ